ncbi:unnamed protein product, partial [Pylaiella littoralis]
MASVGLAKTLERTDYPLRIMHGPPRRALVDDYGEEAVVASERALDDLMEATAGANFQAKVLAAGSVEEAWTEALNFNLLVSKPEQDDLAKQLEDLRQGDGEDPKLNFLKVDEILSQLRAVGVYKRDDEILEILRLNLSYEFEIEKRGRLTQPGMTRSQLENIVRSAHADRRFKWENGTASNYHASSNALHPHALRVDGGFPTNNGEGRGGHRSGGGYYGGGGRGQQRLEVQLTIRI